MTTPEGKVKAKINKRLLELGDKVYRFMPVQTGYGAPGLDYFLCVNGYFVSCEAKTEGKVPTPRQETTMEAIRNARGMTFVVDNDESLDFMMKHLKLLCQ